MSEEKLRIAGHAEAIVTATVEQEDGVVVVPVTRNDEPGAEGDVVRRGDRFIGEFGVQFFRDVLRGDIFFDADWTARWVEGAVGDEDSADGA